MSPDDLPELHWDVLEPGRTFRPLVLSVTAEMVREHALVLGADHDLYERYVPPGFAGILGRRSYLEDFRMPPGGVLLRQSIRWLAPALLDEPIEAVATVRTREERDGRRRVVIDTDARQSATTVCEIEMSLGWPR
ncbi:MAG: hypothetical protein JWQ20_2433 [Conexibacter sp.]|nr:hypothetical protein [Conexibacter sp.]